MAHIFISYSSRYRELTEKLAEYLEGCGLDVYWDTGLSSLKEFDWQLNEQLRIAGAVVVIWTEGAVVSPWVRHEVDYGAARQILVHARAEDLDPAKIPEAFHKFDAHNVGSEREKILSDVLAVREGRLLLEDKREALPGPGARTPTMLLQAKFGLVPFTGGDAILGDLVDWSLARGNYVGPRRRAAGRLIHGAGGLGKTRLLIEVAEILRAQSWSAGFLARPGAGDQPEDTAETRTLRRKRYSVSAGDKIPH